MILTRIYQDDKKIIGILTFDRHQWVTVERPFIENQTFISAIPDGEYPLIRVDSPSHGPNTWRVDDVPGRTYIDIHIANYPRQLEGCIGIGKGILSDFRGVSRSEIALKELYDATDGMTADRIFIITAPFNLMNRRESFL